jgi:hypothetical protein
VTPLESQRALQDARILCVLTIIVDDGDGEI